MTPQSTATADPTTAPTTPGAATGRSPGTTATPPRTGAEVLVATLERLGVEHLFGLPGGAVLPLYDALHSSRRLRHVLVRHEQAAGHAATGYAVSTGKVGVCLATSGPGATNLVTPLADAAMDSVPVVAITGNVPAGSMGTDAFQEADIRSISMPVTKHSFLVTDPDEIGPTIASAFELAASGRPGPVLVDVTKDALAGPARPDRERLTLPGFSVPPPPSAGAVEEAVELLRTCERPVLYVGGGVVRGEAWEPLHRLAERTGLPVVTTLTARGAFPDSHPQHLGMPGMHGTVAAVAALQRADLLVALGARFDDRVTGAPESFAPGARVVHADIDPAEIGKNRAVDVALLGPAADTIEMLVREWDRQEATGRATDHSGWLTRCRGWAHRYPVGHERPRDGLVAPQHVIERIGALSGPDAIFATGVGQHQMWSSQFVRHEHPRQWLSSSGLGTMGYAVPAAMGAQLAHPGRTVWAIDGDGCFQMTNQELTTCAVEGLPVKVAVVNNSGLGMVRQWQTLFFDERHSASNLPSEHLPDVVGLATAMGCVGLRCSRTEDVDDTIRRALEVSDRPVVVDFQVSREAMVWPMVPAGTGNDEVQYARGLRPDFEEDA